MTTVKEIYKNKAIIGQRDDFNNLIQKINKEEPELNMVDNYDRTILLSYKNKETIERFQDVFSKVLNSWLEEDVTCPIQYTYNILPLNQNQCLLRI